MGLRGAFALVASAYLAVGPLGACRLDPRPAGDAKLGALVNGYPVGLGGAPCSPVCSCTSPPSGRLASKFSVPALIAGLLIGHGGLRDT